MLSNVAIKEFKTIYKSEFGKEISDEEALALGTNLLTVFNKVYKPIKKDWLKYKYKNKNEKRRI